MNRNEGPQPLSAALSQLVSLRGLARVRSESQLAELWRDVAAAEWADKTRPVGVRRGILHVAVTSGPLRSELESFHKPGILQALQKAAPHLNLRGVKFQLQRTV